MKYDIILADLDDTLFDFTKSSRQALRETLSAFSLPDGEQCINDYLAINQGFWERFERGEIQKDEIYVGRFQSLFAQYHISANAADANAYYRDRLWRQRNFMPGCETLLARLKPHCRVYIATNGSTETQRLRIADSGLEHYFDGVFISEELDTKKPERKFYDAIFKEIGENLRERAIILGDSLSSDMQGGRNAGITTCFYGDVKKADGRCDYAIDNLLDFLPIVGL